MNPPRNKSAFTLVEILVVFVIIAILVAITIPVIGRIRGKAREAQAVSNMREIFPAFSIYQSDNNGLWPAPSDGKSPGKRWSISHLYPIVYGWSSDVDAPWTYLKDTIFQSPGATDNLMREQFPGDPFALKNYVARGFGMNENLPPSFHNLPEQIPTGENFRNVQKRPLAIRQPSRTMLLIDIPQASGAWLPAKLKLGSERYNGFNNVLYCDGHVARLAFEDIPVGSPASDPKGGPFWWGL